MNRRIVLLTGGPVALSCLPLAVGQWREAEDAAVLSCVASIRQSLASSDPPAVSPADVGAEWRTLDDWHADRMILPASKARPLDCSGGVAVKPPRDPWGNPLRVGVGRGASDGRLEFRVWSAGRDGSSGTSDDLVSPYGEKALVPK
jgi:hypothetical protein